MGALPFLSLLLLIPVGGALAVWLWPQPARVRIVAAAAMGAELLVAIALVGCFDRSDPGFQHVERGPWIPSLNIEFLVGVDGISLLFLPLTVLLFIGVIVASWNFRRALPRLYYSLLLLQLAATIGVYCALDTLLFFLFWELSLLPLYFLVSLWGVGPNRRFAAAKYTLIMLASGVPLLFGFVTLAFNHAQVSGAALPGGLAFDLPTLLATPVSGSLQLIVFLLLLAGFAAKTPVFPLHTWLPALAMEGPVGVSALLVGLKLGVYGLIRFAVPLAPDIARELHWLLAGLGTVGILYGAVTALVQTNLRRMLAYAGLSHVGLVLLGIASFSIQGIEGALMQTLNFVLVAGGLFLLTGFLYRRTGSTDTVSLGGAIHSMPRLGGLFLLFLLAAIGVPGTSGFPAEFLLIVATLNSHTGAGLAALFGAVIGAGYALGMYRRIFLGPQTNPAVAQAHDLRPAEFGLALCYATVIVTIGFWPSLVLDLIAPAAKLWAGRVG
ncbi:MAG: NADH-quinone oxidoreductase subunit M [Sterolibacteriaceae bacterium]|nr:NADH-quinone oxidoreductase subunit M [Candidatus Methylophosphatis haderslevensis]